MDVAAFLLALIAIFVAAKLFGELAERLGQPAVLGELVGGVAARWREEGSCPSSVSAGSSSSPSGS